MIKRLFKSLLDKIAFKKLQEIAEITQEDFEDIIYMIKNNQIQIKNKETKENTGIKIEFPKTLVKHETNFANSIDNYFGGINNGAGNSNDTYFKYENIRYDYCMVLASQVPLISTILKKIADCPFNKGYKIKGATIEECKKIQRLIEQFNIIQRIKECINQVNTFGGSLLYLDFGKPSEDFLRNPLNLEEVDIKDFKGIKAIEPYYVGITKVNGVDVSKQTYQDPEYYNILGLGIVHSSHFIKFNGMYVSNFMKPAYLYFGNSFVNTIRETIALIHNTAVNMVEFSRRMRQVYIKKDQKELLGLNKASKYNKTMALLEKLQNNFSHTIIGKNDEVQSFSSSLGGFGDCLINIIKYGAVISGIPYSMLSNNTEVKVANADNQDIQEINFITSKQQELQNVFNIIVNIFYAKIKNQKYKDIISFEFNNPQSIDPLKQTIIFSKRVETIPNLINCGFTKESIELKLSEWGDFDNFKIDDKIFKQLQENIRLNNKNDLSKQDTGNGLKQSESANDNREVDNIKQLSNRGKID